MCRLESQSVQSHESSIRATANVLSMACNNIIFNQKTDQLPVS